MADTLLTHDMIADRSLFDLNNELTFTKNVYKGYSSEYHASGRFKKGSDVRVHLPNRYRTVNGASISLVDTFEQSTTVSVDTQEHIAFDFTAQQLTLSIEDFSRKYIRPACIAIANKVDYDGTAEAKNLYNQVGTPGTTPSTFAAIAAGAQRLDEEAVPREDRVAVLSPAAHWSMADGELKSVFQQQMVDTLIRKGFIGNFALMDFFMDQNIQAHTNGTGATEGDGSTVTMKANGAEGGTSLSLQGFTDGNTVAIGDILTVATVYGVNPLTSAAWEGNTLRQFVCTALATADASTDATVSISPTLYSPAGVAKNDPYATVQALPATNDGVTIAGAASTAYPLNILMHPDCFAMTMVPFQQPDSAGSSVKWATATDEQLGLSITFASAFDISNYKEIYRLDVLYGWDTIRPELGVRLIG